jgi:hypothetical protein
MSMNGVKWIQDQMVVVKARKTMKSSDVLDAGIRSLGHRNGVEMWVDLARLTWLEFLPCIIDLNLCLSYVKPNVCSLPCVLHNSD